MGGSVHFFSISISNRGQCLQNSVVYVDISRHSMCLLQTVQSRIVISEHVRTVGDKRQRDGIRSDRFCVSCVFTMSLTAQVVHCASGYCCCRLRQLSTGLHEIYCGR